MRTEAKRTELEIISKPGPTRREASEPASASTTGFVDLIHEIRNPLNTMSTSLQLMQRHLASTRCEDSVLLSHVDGLHQELHRLHEILYDLQMIWTTELRLEPVHMQVLITDLLRSEPLNSAGASVRVETDIQKNCPVFEADERLLKRALGNLIKNSLEAMPAGGTLTLRGFVENGRVSIEVMDTGSGIPEQIQVLTRYDTSKPAGMGLGLKIVKQIAGLLHGEVGYSRRPEGGTTFRLSLPQK